MGRRSFSCGTFLTADEMVGLLRLPSRRSLYDKVRRGTCPPPVRFGRRCLWERAEVLRFVEENRVVAPSTIASAEGGGAR